MGELATVSEGSEVRFAADSLQAVLTGSIKHAVYFQIVHLKQFEKQRCTRRVQRVENLVSEPF